MSRREAALAARLRAELQDLERVVERVEHLSREAAERDDLDYCDGVALNLHGFYAGVDAPHGGCAGHLGATAAAALAPGGEPPAPTTTIGRVRGGRSAGPLPEGHLRQVEHPAVGRPSPLWKPA